MAEFSVNIVAKGEEIVYEEQGKRFCFEIYLGRNPNQLFAGKYWSGSVPVVFYKLTEAEKQRIVPRLVEHLSSHGKKTEVVWQDS